MKREYPPTPIVGVGAIIRQDDRLVLIRRAKEPARGYWTFPGGAVELGESLEAAVHREVLEETGLQVELGDVAAVIDRIHRDESGAVRYHFVIVDYHARPVGGALRPGDDAGEARWVALEDLDALDMTEKAAGLARALLQTKT